MDLPESSFIVFDMGYVDYKVYQQYSESHITYITKMKSNAVYESMGEMDIPDDADYIIHYIIAD